MATPYQSIDPALLALQTAKKAMPASPSMQQKKKPVLQSNMQQSQALFATSPATPAKIGGISSPIGATNINSSPILGGATPQDMREQQTFINNQPKVPNALPKTGADKYLSKDKIKEIMQGLPDRAHQEEAFKQLIDRGYTIQGYNESESQLGQKDNFITDLGSGIGQRVAGFGNLGKKLAFGAVDLYRQSQGKEKLTPEQRASAEQTPMGQALNTITNRQTPEQKASVGGQIGMVVGSVAQGAALGTPLTSALGKIPGVAQIATKAPVLLSKIAGGVAQGLEGQLQYSAAAEGKLPTSKELFTAGAFGGAVNAIGPIAKGIKDMKFKPIESIARKITGTSDDYGKLFKSAEPRTNQLNKSVDYKNLQKNHNIASEEIIKAGYKPVDTASRAEAHANTMKKIRKEEIESKIGSNFRINLNPVADKIDEFVLKQKTAGLLKNEGQLAELKAQADKFRKMGEVDGADGEFIKEMLNSQINNRGDASLGDVYKNGLKEATKTLGQSLDDTFSAIPGQFAEAKKRFGALKATYQDVVKADIKAQKAKGLGLGETFGRIEGIGDILGAVGGLVTGKNPLPQLASGFGKLAVGKVLAKIKDKDFLIQEGFEGLSKKIPVTNTINISKKGTQLGSPLLKQTKAPTAITPSGVIKQVPNTPKPTPKTPPITVERGAIGMGTPKVNKTPAIPPKATVAPSVSAPKKVVSKYIPGETDISNYSLGEYRDLVKEQYPGIHTENDIQRMYKTLQDEGTITKAPKKGMPKLTANTSKVATIEGSLLQEAKKYKSSSDFIEYLRTSIDDYTEGDRLTAEPKGLEKQRLDFINYIENKYPNKSGWFSSARQYFDDVVSKNKPVPKKGMPKLGKEIMEQNITQGDDLINEAKKYKSADEFVNKNIFYRGETGGGGNYYSTSKDFALEFTPSGLEKEVMKKGILQDEIYKQKELPFAGSDKEISNAINIAKKNGKKAILVSEGVNQPNSVFVFDKSALKTEAQLKQIREQANKKTLPPLPKKGK